MRTPKFVTAQDLDRWGASEQSKTKLPEVLRRLVMATVPREDLKKVDFPSGAETSRPGYDGTTATTVGTAFVPPGIGFWELGCVVGDRRGKAQRDYDTRIEEHQRKVAAGETNDLSAATFVAVTPLDWQDGQKWASEREKDGYYGHVRAYDSNALEHWLQDAPAVGLWVAREIHGPGRCEGLVDIGSSWRNTQDALVTPLPPAVLLTNRESITTAFEKWIAGPASELAVRSSSGEEVVAVFCAWVVSLQIDRSEAVLSRGIVVEARETWKALCSSIQPLIFVASPRLELDSALTAEAIRNGHHVLRFAQNITPRSIATVEMPVMRRFDLAEALERGGLTQANARQLAGASGGNFTILRRLHARLVEQAPLWAKEQSLAPLLLACSWREDCAADITIVERLAAENYGHILKLVTRWRESADAPVRLVNGIWQFLSLVDSWEMLSPVLNASDVARFADCAVEVLSEDNPALELPADERYLASVKGKVWRYSPELRRGLAEVMALASSREAEGGNVNRLHMQNHATAVVRRVLGEGCTWKRWASLGDLLPLFIEAAPDAVLEAIERDLKADRPELFELMRQESSTPLGGYIYHAGLLWALERAAWAETYFLRTALSLLRLAVADPGIKSGNTPLNSVASIFLPWFPQTMASINARTDALNYLASKNREGVWLLVTRLLPSHHTFTMEHSKPAYRSWAAGWTREVKEVDYLTSISHITGLVLSLASERPVRWITVLQRFSALTGDDRSKVLDAIEAINPESVEDTERTQLWDELGKRQYTPGTRAGAKSVTVEVGERFDRIRQKFSPKDKLIPVIRLFDDEGHAVWDDNKTDEEAKQDHHLKRSKAICDIWFREGIAAVLEIVRRTRGPWAVGICLGNDIPGAIESIIPKCLNVDDNATRTFAEAFARVRISKEAPSWAVNYPQSSWTEAQIVRWALCMPFEPTTWDWIAARGDSAEHLYWQQTGVWGRSLDLESRLRAVKCLQTAGRPWAAIEHLTSFSESDRQWTEDIVCSALEHLVSSPIERSPETMDLYYIGEMFEFLQQLENANDQRLARLEFAFLEVLHGHSRLPLTLHRQLAKSPEFFVECLCALYKPHKQTGDIEQGHNPTAAESNKAEKIWHLLREWEIIPGSAEGHFSQEELTRWVTKARKLASEADRLEVCDVTIGEVFASSPEDSDGAKPIRAIREIIEQCESPEIERGLRIGFFNSRGCTMRKLHEGGDQERELAREFEAYATICIKWPRTSAALLAMRDEYLHDAQRQDDRAKTED
jgi:hypothetical protein